MPIDFNKTNNILIIGNGDILTSPVTGGEGSGRVDASYIQSPVDELTKRLGVEAFTYTGEMVQRHCDKDGIKCVIYAKGNDLTPSSIPS